MKSTGYIPSTERAFLKLYRRLESTSSAIYGSSMDSKDVVKHLQGTGKGKLSLPHLSLQKFRPQPFSDEPQQTNDCTSHGSRNASDLSRAFEIDVKREPESFVCRSSSAPIYWNRGSYADSGMQPADAAYWLNSAGVLLEKKYPFADLSTYSASLAVKYGGRVPQAAIEEASKHPQRFMVRVSSIDDARDLLANGYGLFGGFFQWVRPVRDRKGIMEMSGSTAHCVCIFCCDDTGTEPLFGLGNSWPSTWVSGGHPDWGPLPDGSGLVRAMFIQDAISRGDLFAIGNTEGFPPQKLPDYGTGDYL